MFDRVIQALAVSSPGRFYILYGSGIEDIFVDEGGAEWNIEQALFSELKVQGYERVVYSSPHRPVFFLDEQSSTRTWPSAAQPPKLGSKEEGTAHTTRVGIGPFGPRMLKSSSPAPQPPNFSQHGMGDTFLINLLNTIMLDTRNGRSAVVLLQAETLLVHFESRRILASLIGEWARLPTANFNTCLLVFSAAHLEQLKGLAANVPVPEIRNSILDSTKTSFAVLREIGSPQKDELSRLTKQIFIEKSNEITAQRLADMISAEGGSMRLWLNRLKSSKSLSDQIIRNGSWFQ